jgi:tight adherence protein C
VLFQILFLAILFLVVVCATIGIFQWLLDRRHRSEMRNLQSEEPSTSTTETMILGPLTPILAEQSPMSEPKQTAMQRELREAGFYQPQALTEYRAMRAVLVLMPLIVAGILAFLGQRADIGRTVLAGGVLACLGYAVPRLYIQYRSRVRARELERGLPVAIDLLNLALTGGQNISAALRSVAREIAHSYPVLSEEFEIVRHQAELSHLGAALQKFAERTNHPDVRNLAMVLAQTERLGTDVSAGLLEYGNNLQLNMRHRAEAAANRASFWMLFPTILCLSIPAALLLVSPVYMEFWKRREDMKKAFPESTRSVEKLNKMKPQNTEAESSRTPVMPISPITSTKKE